MKFRCVVEGCTSVIDVENPSKDFRYVCSGRVAYGDDKLNHTREQQLAVIGRKYSPTVDEADKDIHFQPAQYDDEIKRKTGGKP